MLELAPAATQGLYRRGVAGDSYNTAVYLARAGMAVSYLTRLGDDALSDDIVARLQAEGIDTTAVQRCSGRRPGLYIIDNDADGERTFHYWRGESPVRELFRQAPDIDVPDLFYFTGITLAVTQADLGEFSAFLQHLTADGCRVVFDPNYRPALWRDRAQARRHCEAILPYCDTVLPTLEDDSALWDLHSIDDCRALYAQHGVRETVIKGAQLTSHAFAAGASASRQASPVTALDTTGAGDSFNAGYLAARLAGEDLDSALARAQRLAAEVVQHRGAIIPRH